MNRETPGQRAGGLLVGGRRRSLQDVSQPGLPLCAISQNRLPCIQDVAVEQCVERFGVLAVDTVLVDHEVREERLIEQPAQLRIGGQVRNVTVTGKVEGAYEVGLDGIERCRSRAEPSLDSGQLVGDALLLAGDEVHRDCTAVDRFEQFLPLCGELRFFGQQVLVLIFSVLAVGGELSSEALLDHVAELGGEPDGGPVVLDHLLDLGDEQRFAGTTGGLLVAPEADEVRIDNAMAVLGVGDDQAAAAVTAEDARLEVVRVLALAFADEVGGKNVLDLLPGDRVHQPRVAAGIGNTPIHHLTLVVGVGQDAVQDVGSDRARWHLGGSPCSEPPGLEFVCQ
nr:hypothetical protein [Streptomyces sp. TRM70350]